MMLPLIVTLALVFEPAVSPPRCSMVALPITRDSAATYMVATAAPDTSPVPSGGPAAGLAWVPAEHRRTTAAQRMRVGYHRGPDSLRLEQSFARIGDRSVLVVPWTYGPGCEPWWWSESARWAPVGSPAAYRLRLRAPEEWGGTIPVLDALVADLQPYPFGILAPRAPDTTAMTPEQYVDLMGALPTVRDAESRREVALAKIDAWVRRNPELAGLYPAVHVVRNVRAWLRR